MAVAWGAKAVVIMVVVPAAAGLVAGIYTLV